jgi:hypothetical protein
MMLRSKLERSYVLLAVEIIPPLRIDVRLSLDALLNMHDGFTAVFG